MQPQMDETRLNAKHRVMVILWGALVCSVGFYFMLSLVLPKTAADGSEGRIITFALTATGTFLTIVSFVIKQKFLVQAEATQSPALVQTGHIIALALSEGAALLGLLDYLITGNRYYYIMFVVALIGMLLHFPNRDRLAAAAYRQQNRIE